MNVSTGFYSVVSIFYFLIKHQTFVITYLYSNLEQSIENQERDYTCMYEVLEHAFLRLWGNSHWLNQDQTMQPDFGALANLAARMSVRCLILWKMAANSGTGGYAMQGAVVSRG